MREMDKSSQMKIVASVSVDLDGLETRIEKLSTGEGWQTAIQISRWKKGKDLTGPLVLSEEQLIELLHKATHAGVLSRDFIGKLRARIEI
jgi:hypothetical protein